VGVPWSQDQGRSLRTASGASWFELQPASRGWAYWLGAAGLAFSMHPQDRVNALAGPAAWRFDETDLKQWLAAGLLLDGEAASILVQRGLGRWIGLRDLRPVRQEEVLYSMEICRDPRFALRSGAQISLNAKEHTQRIFQGGLEGRAYPISDLLDPLQRVVGHGTLIFENELGGRVAVTPWSATASSTPLMDIHRAAQLRRLVDWLARGQPTGSVEGSAWLVAEFLSDGGAWRGVLWNAGPDEVYHLRFQRPKDMPPVQRIWQLSWNGARRTVIVDGETIHLNEPLYQWDLLVLEA
jgi:hypothetical protein